MALKNALRYFVQGEGEPIVISDWNCRYSKMVQPREDTQCSSWAFPFSDITSAISLLLGGSHLAQSKHRKNFSSACEVGAAVL